MHDPWEKGKPHFKIFLPSFSSSFSERSHPKPLRMPANGDSRSERAKRSRSRLLAGVVAWGVSGNLSVVANRRNQYII